MIMILNLIKILKLMMEKEALVGQGTKKELNDRK